MNDGMDRLRERSLEQNLLALRICPFDRAELEQKTLGDSGREIWACPQCEREWRTAT